MLEERSKPEEKKSGLASQKRRSLFSVLFHSRANKNIATGSSGENNSLPPPADEAITTSGEHWSDSDEFSGSSAKKELKSTKSNNINSVQDQDSYVFDLNERLAEEKLNGVESSEDETDHLKRCASDDRLAPKEVPAQTNRSPLLEQFLKSHKIHLGSIETDLANSRSSSPSFNLNLSSSASSSEPSSLASIELRSGELQGAQVRRPETPDQERAARERDLRLVHWRLKAAKSIWSANSLPSSDSELDLLDCQSPALVISCSDDTSCSSVELIWTPRRVAPDCELLETVGDQVNKELDGSDQKEVMPATSRNRILQRLSIFELAKPSRARAKRFKRKSSRAPLPVDDAQWVPNPLFGVRYSEQRGQVLRRSASYESVITRPAKTLDTSDSNNNSNNNNNRNNDLSAALLSSDNDDDGATETTISDLEDSPELDQLGSTNTVKKVKKKKSKRGKSSSSSARRRKRENIYLNHIMNLNRGIKSNVSSIRSQLSVKLSDTSKRASILADQFISSIKDTTKEQLFSGWPTADRTTNALNASSFSIPQNLNSNIADCEANDKAKLFSLIYKHQQQANGKAVITRQPMPASGLGSISKPASPSPTWLSTGQQDDHQPPNKPLAIAKPIPPPRPAPPKSVSVDNKQPGLAQEQQPDATDLIKDQQLGVSDERTASRNSVGIQTSPVPEINEKTKADTDTHSKLINSFLEIRKSDRYLTTSSATTTRRRRWLRKTAARLASPSDHEQDGDEDDDDDDEDFYHDEYSKLKSSLANKDINLNRDQSQIRTLNYWRRFKMRKLGAACNQPGVYARDRSHSLDLSDLRGTASAQMRA